MLRKAMLFCVLILFIPALVLGELIDNGDGTVMDTGTGLMWVNSDKVLLTSDGLDWEGANLAADALVFPVVPTPPETSPKYYEDWRLPSIKELASIMDYSKSNPAMNTTFFKNVKATYWSSTSYWEIIKDAVNKDVTVWSLAWYVNTADASITTKKKSEKCYVIAVRGGQNQLVTDNGYVSSPTIDSDWYVNNVVPILWTAGKAIKGDVKISLSRDRGKTFTEVIAAGTSNDGVYMWTPTEACENCVIQISASDGTAAGSTVQGPFSIGKSDSGVKGDYNGNDKLDLGDGVGILKELTE